MLKTHLGFPDNCQCAFVQIDASLCCNHWFLFYFFQFYILHCTWAANCSSCMMLFNDSHYLKQITALRTLWGLVFLQTPHVFLLSLYFTVLQPQDKCRFFTLPLFYCSGKSFYRKYWQGTRINNIPTSSFHMLSLSETFSVFSLDIGFEKYLRVWKLDKGLNPSPFTKVLNLPRIPLLTSVFSLYLQHLLKH